MSDVIAPPTASAAQARRNHRWMILLALTPVVFIILYVIAVNSPHNGEPVVSPLRSPPGYSPITDAYYGYSIPSGWHENSAFSDANGDFLYNGPGGWAGEQLSVHKVSPTPSTPLPSSLRAFGVGTAPLGTPQPLAVSDGHRIHVPGTSFAWEVRLSRPDGFHAEAIDTWEPRSETELWLMVHASPAIDTAVLATLQGSATN